MVPDMLAISRFRVDDPTFEAEAEQTIAWWARRAGCLGIDLVRNLDEPDLWAIVSRWESVGAYRRSFNGYEAKMVLTPLLSRAINEAGAYLPPSEL